MSKPTDTKKLEVRKLRLSFLKENFRYREHWDLARKRARRGEVLNLRAFGIPPLQDKALSLSSDIQRCSPRKAYDFILDVLDPVLDIGDFSPPELLPHILEILFPERGITTLHDPWSFLLEMEPDRSVGLQPYERVLKIDLRVKKRQLIAEFEEYLRKQFAILRIIKKGPQPGTDEYLLLGSECPEWDTDQTRSREEVWQHLAVWKARRQRKRFSRIAKEHNLTVDAAKKSFYRAYELTQGRAYDRESLRRDLWIDRKSEIKKTCSNCEQRAICNTMCPDVLRYVNQDFKPSTTEYLLAPEALDRKGAEQKTGKRVPRKKSDLD